MNKSTEGLHILSAEITNFKNITHKEIDIDGRSLMVVGPNRIGKSSFLQALMTPLDANYKPLSPVKEDEERGSIELVIGGILNGEKKKYTVEMYFSPGKQKGRLVLLDEEGQKIPSPQGALEAIIGNIGFDIMDFLSLSKTRGGAHSKEGALKQVEILKSLLPKEVRDELTLTDIKIKEITTKREALNREIKELAEKQKHGYTDEQLEEFSKPKNIEEIEKKLTDIGDASQKYANAVSAKSRLEKEIADDKKEISSGLSAVDAETNISELDALVSRLKQTNDQKTVTFMVHLNKYKGDLQKIVETAAGIPAKEKMLANTNKWFEKNKEPKSDLIVKELSDANKHNETCKLVAKLKEEYIELEKKKKRYDEMEVEIKDLKDRKRNIFALNHLQVKGLTFDEDQVLYNGLPLDDNQQASSTIIGVGVKIAMLMNPNLKVIVIKDGSLLDKETANQILKMINKYGYQLLIEIVSWDKEEMQINFIEKEFE